MTDIVDVADVVDIEDVDEAEDGVVVGHINDSLDHRALRDVADITNVRPPSPHRPQNLGTSGSTP